MPDDIRPYGASAGLGYYWVRKQSYVGPKVSGGYLALITVGEHGTVMDTGSRRPDDEAGRSEADAVLIHLAAGIEQADADLERRRAERADQPPPEPVEPPADPATEKFLSDDEGW